jgi:hypothetical protein
MLPPRQSSSPNRIGALRQWRRHFNEARPHSSLCYLTPKRVRGPRSNSSAPQCNGPGPAVYGASAPRFVAQPAAGTNAASKGSRLKLTVVRRIWPGHHRLRSKRAIFCRIEAAQNIILVWHPPIPRWDGSLQLVNNVAPPLHLPDWLRIIRVRDVSRRPQILAT